MGHTNPTSNLLVSERCLQWLILPHPMLPPVAGLHHTATARYLKLLIQHLLLSLGTHEHLVFVPRDENFKLAGLVNHVHCTVIGGRG